MSKWSRIWGFLLLVTLCLSLKIFPAAAAPQLPQFSPDRVLVAFSPGTAAADVRAAHQQAGGQVIKRITAIGVEVIKVPAGTVQEKIKLYERNPNVRYAEPNYLRPLIVPIEGNFTGGPDVFDEQWSLHNTGRVLQTYVDPAPQLPQFSPDRVLVAFSPGTAAADVRAAHQQAGGQVIKRITAIGVEVIKVPAGTVQEKIKLYERNPNVRYAEPNYLRPLIVPIEGNFTGGPDVFDEQWSLHNTGRVLQTYVDPATALPIYTLLDSDIDAPEAWDLSKGSSAIRVAVVDSGVDCGHPDLVGKCMDNEGHVSRATVELFCWIHPSLLSRYQWLNHP